MIAKKVVYHFVRHDVFQFSSNDMLQNERAILNRQFYSNDLEKFQLYRN